MAFFCSRAYSRYNRFAILLFFVPLLMLAGCGDSAGTSIAAQSQGQQLLIKVAHNLNAARFLHGIFNLSITDRTANQSFKTEIWKELSSKNREIILQSSLIQVPTGMLAVTDGSQEWLYNPVKKVAYTNLVLLPSSDQTAIPVSGSSGFNGQLLLPLRLMQQALALKDATLNSSPATVDGHIVYDVHVAPQVQTQGEQYAEEVYIDKTTELPVQVVLNTQGAGNDVKEVVDIPLLTLNVAIPDNTFIFAPPVGTQIQSFPQSSTGTGSITLAQAQIRAGYHLLSIPPTLAQYVLQSVAVLGSTGHEIYELAYKIDNSSFLIDESKSLANDATDYPGQQINVRGTTGTISTDSGVTTLYWTENGVGITISGSLSEAQVIGIAQILA